MKRPFKLQLISVIRSDRSGRFWDFNFVELDILFSLGVNLFFFLLLDYSRYDEHPTWNIHSIYTMWPHRNSKILSIRSEWDHSTKQNTSFNGLHSLPMRRRATNFTDAYICNSGCWFQKYCTLVWYRSLLLKCEYERKATRMYVCV